MDGEYGLVEVSSSFKIGLVSGLLLGWLVFTATGRRVARVPSKVAEKKVERGIESIESKLGLA